MPAEPDFINEVDSLEKSEDAPEPEAKEIYPFKAINRGEDTLDSSGAVVFADFSPIVLPSSVAAEALGLSPVEEDEDFEEPAPKDESAPEGVDFLEDQKPTAPKPSGTNVSKDAASDDGQASPKKTG